MKFHKLSSNFMHTPPIHSNNCNVKIDSFWTDGGKTTFFNVFLESVFSVKLTCLEGSRQPCSLTKYWCESRGWKYQFNKQKKLVVRKSTEFISPRISSVKGKETHQSSREQLSTTKAVMTECCTLVLSYTPPLVTEWLDPFTYASEDTPT